MDTFRCSGGGEEGGSCAVLRGDFAASKSCNPRFEEIALFPVSGDAADSGGGLVGGGRSRARRRRPSPRAAPRAARGRSRVVESPSEDPPEDRAAGAAKPARLVQHDDRLLEGVRRPRHGAQVREQGGDGADQGEGEAAAVHALHDQRVSLYLRHQVHEPAAGGVQGQLREGMPGTDSIGTTPGTAKCH